MRFYFLGGGFSGELFLASCEVPPGTAGFDAVNVAAGYTEILADDSREFAVIQTGTDLQHVTIRQLGSTVSRSFKHRTTSFGVSVRYVAGVRTQEQMFWAHTKRVIASVCSVDARIS